MIKPTIGRVVLVHRGISNQPEPALICYVHSDRCINIGGFDCNGQPFSATSVQLLQDEDVPYGGIYAEWMQYQKGQAAKAEQLQRVIDTAVEAGKSEPNVHSGSSLSDLAGHVAPGGAGESETLAAA